MDTTPKTPTAPIEILSIRALPPEHGEGTRTTFTYGGTEYFRDDWNAAVASGVDYYWPSGASVWPFNDTGDENVLDAARDAWLAENPVGPAVTVPPRVEPTVWVAVVEWGEDYADRSPGITVATTEAAARQGAAQDVWDFLQDVAEPEPSMEEFMAEQGESFRESPEAAAAWLDAMRLDYDVPAFLTVESRPILP